MRRYIFSSFIFVLLYPTAIDLYLVGLPTIAADLGASESQLHYAFSIYLAGMATTMLAAGKLADRVGRKPVVIGGALLFIATSLLAAAAQEPMLFFVARFGQGVGAGACYVSAFAILRDVLDDQRRAKVLSMLNGITCTVPVLAPVVGHLIMLQFSWQSLFTTMALMGAVAALVALFLYRETLIKQPVVQMANDTGSETLLAPRFISSLGVAAIAFAVILTFVNVSPMLLMDKLGFSRGQYSMVVTATALLGMTTSFLSPLLITRFARRALILGAQLLFICAALLLFAEVNITTTLIALGLISIGFSLGFGVITGQALAPFTRRAAEASSILAIVQVCSAALYIWIAGWFGLSPLMMLVSLLLVGGLVSIGLICFGSNHDEGINEQTRCLDWILICC